MFLPSVLISLLLIIDTAVSDLIPFDNWAHQLVALQNTSIHFRYAGTGPPILLVHGFPEHSVSKAQGHLSPSQRQETLKPGD
jgi:hypothetical protein